MTIIIDLFINIYSIRTYKDRPIHSTKNAIEYYNLLVHFLILPVEFRDLLVLLQP